MITKSIFQEPIARRALLTILRYINAQDVRNHSWGITYLYEDADLHELFDLTEKAPIVEGEYLYLYFDEPDEAEAFSNQWPAIPMLAGECDKMDSCSVLLIRIL